MTSCYIHLFPGWLSLTLRWCPLDTLRGGEEGAEPECTAGVDAGDVMTSIALYVVWQALYYLKTELYDKVRKLTHKWELDPVQMLLAIILGASFTKAVSHRDKKHQHEEKQSHAVAGTQDTKNHESGVPGRAVILSALEVVVDGLEI